MKIPNVIPWDMVIAKPQGVAVPGFPEMNPKQAWVAATSKYCFICLAAVAAAFKTLFASLHSFSAFKS